MKGSNIRRWQDEFPGEPSEAFLRNWFVPPNEYRISKHFFPVGTAFPGSMRRGTIFVFGGSCAYNVSGVNFFLSKGDIIELPGGDYIFSVEGDEPAEFVLVWKLLTNSQ